MGRSRSARALLGWAAAGLVAAGCLPASIPPPPPRFASASPANVRPTGTIVAIRHVASSPIAGDGAIEIEVRSERAFPVRNEIAVLRIGEREFLLSRYPLSGDLHTLIFTLTTDEFASVADGEPVVVQYGRGVQAEQWDLGRLRKPAGLVDPPAPLYFDGVTEPGRRGGFATVTLHTAPGVHCIAVFLWPGMPDGGQPVSEALTDSAGTAALRWPVDPLTPSGSWRIDATCGSRTVSTHVPIQ